MKRFSSNPFWKKIPDQIWRLLIVFVILLTILFFVRKLLVPPDFGKYGHYRASAVTEIANLPIKYAGSTACSECHDEESEIKKDGYHRNLSCEVCHGAGSMHIEDPDTYQLRKPTGRGFCPLCHEYLPSRPTGFPQIVAAYHNPLKPCITCHNPHNPKPPRTPQECAACHANIARTKAVSHHTNVPCTRCHQAPEEHKIKPRTVLPTKPQNRQFCGGCHASKTGVAEGIPQIQLDTHGIGYVCWQCHYPHLPEVK